MPALRAGWHHASPSLWYAVWRCAGDLLRPAACAARLPSCFSLRLLFLAAVRCAVPTPERWVRPGALRFIFGCRSLMQVQSACRNGTGIGVLGKTEPASGAHTDHLLADCGETRAPVRNCTARVRVGTEMGCEEIEPHAGYETSRSPRQCGGRYVLPRAGRANPPKLLVLGSRGCRCAQRGRVDSGFALNERATSPRAQGGRRLGRQGSRGVEAAQVQGAGSLSSAGGNATAKLPGTCGRGI